ncbi:30S ribosomal protein S3 [Candidatus Termititenax spirochaetophilus]|uniref:Small ribosomal subunit protein uS3 n=1 Tax=Candidatus Termititenax spirochaetophilus TaxID=2218522 RepID=A0A388T7S9_9BACT|nr:30S ribosomal protein S3 [Candidatus Termititenax spirochaetophilus]
MGHKTDPRSLRLGINKEWDRVWYASKKDFAKYFLEDQKIEDYIKVKLSKASISRVVIRRRSGQITIDLYAARPGMIIGKGGADAEAFKQQLVRLTNKNIQLNINESANINTCAILLAENVASQLERRIAFRRAMKQIITKALKSGAQGIKVMVSGRLGGAEIARTEWYREGRVPLHTFRADLDYATAEAQTTYGKIGVKVWVYKGDILDKKNVKLDLKPSDVEIEEEKDNVNA